MADPQAARPSGWEARLAAVIAAARARPYAWGSHDCAIFALEAIDAQLGSCHAARFRGRYDGPLAASALFGPDGLEGFVTAEAAAIGLGERPPRLAPRGSVALGHGPLGPTLGVVLGREVAHPGARGLALEPRGFILRAWSFI